MSDTVDISLCFDIKNTLQQELVDLKNLVFYRKQELEELNTLIARKEKNISEIQKTIIANCKHKWERDFIDSMKGYKLSQPIKYCKKCELTDITS